jgi:hypothetical protein
VSDATELYPADAGAKLAQELYDTGLLFQLNHVLSPHALMLGVSMASLTDQVVDGLSLHECSERYGRAYRPESVIDQRQRLYRAGLLRTNRILVEPEIVLPPGVMP